MDEKSENAAQQARPPKWIVIGLILMAFSAWTGLAWMVTVAVRKVLAGQGLETFRTVWLVEFNWIGLLVLLAVIIVALTVAMLFSWREERLWRDFERKYIDRV